ncbi:MAG: carbohydrate porin [Planctomycetes bacterium]|nr:carbohydrate porin [Planctomycetota bacterium]
MPAITSADAGNSGIARRHVPLSTALLACLSNALAAQEEPRDWLGSRPLHQWQRLTGDWGGTRTQLEDLGVEVAGGLTADLAGPWSGGIRQRGTLTTLLDLNIAFDLERLLGLPRTLAYVDAYRIHGGNPSNHVGDAQGVSNIAANGTEQIAELWLETWLGEQFRAKFGKVDFNSEFAFNELGGEFVHSTAGITPCILGFPTYPNPAMSANLFYVPSECCYVGAAVYDGAVVSGTNTGKLGPSGFFGGDNDGSYLFAAEAGVTWTGGESWGSGRLALGAYTHTARLPRFDGGSQHGAEGLWATFEQRLWREQPAVADDRQGLGLFVAGGLADARVSAFGATLACGCTWTGWWPGRDYDALGFAILHADLSDRAGAGTPEDETAFELMCKVQVTPFLVVKPDLQYVLHPGGAPEIDHALVALLRFECMF